MCDRKEAEGGIYHRISPLYLVPSSRLCHAKATPVLCTPQYCAPFLAPNNKIIIGQEEKVERACVRACVLGGGIGDPKIRMIIVSVDTRTHVSISAMSTSRAKNSSRDVGKAGRWEAEVGDKPVPLYCGEKLLTPSPLDLNGVTACGGLEEARGLPGGFPASGVEPRLSGAEKELM